MSGASINFRVNDVGVSSFMANMQQKSTQMTNNLIKDAQKQTDIAKEQLQLIERQIAAQLRKSKLEGDNAQAMIRASKDARISNIDRRGETIDLLAEQNKKRYKDGEISREEYLNRRKRIDTLGDRNTEQSINSDTTEKIQQAKEAARQNELLARNMRENIEAVKTSSQQQILQIRRGDEAIVNSVDENSVPTDRLANQLASQQIQDNDPNKGSGEGWKRDMLTLANAITVEKVGGMLANIPNTKNELEFIKPMMATAGMAAGGLTGSAIDAVEGASVFGFSLGQTNLGAIGAQLGEKFGEFAGGSLERSFKAREALSDKNFKLQALVGIGLGIDTFKVGSGGTGQSSVINQDLSKYGLNYSQVSDLQYQLASRKGSAKNLARDAENVVALEEGIGVTKDVSFALMELVRSNKSSDKNVMNIVGGVLQKGQGTIFKDGDRSFLNEFLTRNYLQLQKAMLTTQNSTSSGTVFDILKRFDSVGGQFSAQDPRSTGLVNQIQGSLANPGSDNLKALAFTVMRKRHPEMGIAALLEEQQKGMGSSMYMSDMLEEVKKMGGGKDMQIMNIAGMFGLQNNISAARSIYENQTKLKGGISKSNLSGSGQYSEAGIRALGEDQVNIYTKSTAQIENAFIESALDGILLVGTKMKELTKDMLKGVETYVDQQVDNLIHGKKDSPSPNKNKTYTSTSGARAGGRRG